MTVYPQRRTSERDDRSEGVSTMSISYHDVEKLQALYPNHQIELKEGKLILMGPSDAISAIIGARFIAFLSPWVFRNNRGQVLDSSIGYRLPDGDLLSPAVSFVSRERQTISSPELFPGWEIPVTSIWPPVFD